MGKILKLRNRLTVYANKICNFDEKMQTKTCVGDLLWQVYLFALALVWTPFKSGYLLCVKINSKKFY